MNVCFTQHDHAGTIGAYLDDLDAARRDAQQRTDAALASGVPATTLALEFRYALMAASVVGLDSHLPAELVARLAATGVWDARPASAVAEPQAAREQSAKQRQAPLAEQVARARRARGRAAKLQALTRLLPQLDAQARADVTAEALALARSLPRDHERAAAMVDLAPYLPVEALAEVLAAAGGNPYALTRLAPSLPEDQRSAALAEALTAARRLPGVAGAGALAAVVPQVTADQRPVLVAEALVVLRSDGRGWYNRDAQRDVLAALAAHLPPESVEEALALAGSLTHESGSLSGEYVRAGALTRMASVLPAAALPALLARAGGLIDRRLRAEVVAAAAERLAAELLPAAVDVVRAYHDERDRAAALAAFARHLPAGDRSSLLSEVLTAAGPVTGPRGDAWAIPALASCLPAELLAELVGAARSLVDPYDRAWTLARLAPRLPAEQRRAIQAEALAGARWVDHHNGLVPELVEALAPDLPVELLHLALAMNWSAGVLVRLAAHLPAELVGRAFDIASDAYVSDEHVALALAALAPRLPVELVPVAVATARRLDAPWGWSVLEALGPRLPDGVVAELIGEARNESWRWERVRMVSGMAPFLRAGASRVAFVEVLADAGAEPDPGLRASMLAELVPLLPDDLRAGAVADVLAAAREARDPQRSASRGVDRLLPELAWLLARLPDADRPAVLTEALSIADSMPAQASRVRGMVALARYLPADRQPEILAAVAGLPDEGRRAEALAELAPVLPPVLLAEALAAVGGSAPVTAVLRRAHELWRVGHAVPLVDLVRRALHGADRRLCLAIAVEIAPIVDELGGAAAVTDCIEAIRAVQRWWP